MSRGSLPKEPVPESAYTREYFLSHCGGHERFSFHESQLGGALLRCFLRAEVKPGDRVLDLGCGRGDILFACQCTGAHAYGTDYSTAAVEIVCEHIRQNKLREIIVVQAALPDVGFSDTRFDKVFLLDVVEHITEPVLLASLDSIARVMSEQGTLIIHTDNKLYKAFTVRSLRIIRSLLTGRLQREDEHEKLHINYQSLGKMIRKLKTRGYRMVHADYVTPASIDEFRPWTNLRGRTSLLFAYTVLKALLATPLRHILCPTFDIVAARVVPAEPMHSAATCQ